MKVMGIDQSTTLTGYSLFEDNKLIDYGVVNFKKVKNPTERIDLMKNWISDYIDECGVEFVVLEDTFLASFKGKATGVTTYALLNRNLGVIENMIYNKKIPYVIAYPKVWKSVMKIKGRGRAEQKANTMLRVYDIFEKRTTEDEADAICLGAYACIEKPWETTE